MLLGTVAALLLLATCARPQDVIVTVGKQATAARWGPPARHRCQPCRELSVQESVLLSSDHEEGGRATAEATAELARRGFKRQPCLNPAYPWADDLINSGTSGSALVRMPCSTCRVRKFTAVLNAEVVGNEVGNEHSGTASNGALRA